MTSSARSQTPSYGQCGGCRLAARRRRASWSLERPLLCAPCAFWDLQARLCGAAVRLLRMATHRAGSRCSRTRLGTAGALIAAPHRCAPRDPHRGRSCCERDHLVCGSAAAPAAVAGHRGPRQPLCDGGGGALPGHRRAAVQTHHQAQRRRCACTVPDSGATSSSAVCSRLFWRRATQLARRAIDGARDLRAGLSLRSQELTALFLAVRLFCRCSRSPN